jgi:hypothetical protein
MTNHRRRHLLNFKVQRLTRRLAGFQGSPSIGYLLAFNYLKAKRHVEAIDVANEVIKRFPAYPRIRTEVLQVAMQSLRP